MRGLASRLRQSVTQRRFLRQVPQKILGKTN
jgi:hypothetical protein